MANSPSEKWVDGKLVARAIETNRWTVPADNDTEPEEAEVSAKAVASTDTENKSVKAAKKK